MNRAFILTLCLFVQLSVNAQFNDYQFSQSVSPYAQVSSAVKASPPMFFQNGTPLSITLPFEFKVKDIIADRVLLNPFGDIQLLEKSKNWGILLISSSIEMRDYYNNGGIYYQSSGAVGKRVVRLEYRNLEPELGIDDNSVNFQVWLNEEDYSIVYRYGFDSSITPIMYANRKGPVVGIFDINQDFTYNTSFFLTGTAVQPNFSSEQLPGKTSDTIPYMSTNIPKNTQFTFTPKTNTTNVVKADGVKHFKVYPNPSTNQDITVVFDNDKGTKIAVALMSIDGRIINTKTSISNKVVLDTKGLSKGVYMIQVQKEGMLSVEKVFIN